MSSRLGKRDFKGWGNLETLVNEYEAKKTIEILLPRDIENLKTAKDRTTAYKFAHPDVNDVSDDRVTVEGVGRGS